MAGNASEPKRKRRGWSALRALALFVVAAWPQHASADPAKGEVKVTVEGGYARILFRMDETVEADARLTGAVMIVSFKQPVDIAVDKLNANAPNYISAARLDPDGRAIRIALARKVKINTIPAAERIYIDLLPEGWAGMLPGLPQDVIDELARRTREAERQLNAQRLAAKRLTPMMSRVRFGAQPTFSRYVFEAGARNVVPETTDGALTLNFDQPIKFDLADVKAGLPPAVQSVETSIDQGATVVTFRFNGQPEVRTFREDGTFVVDVGNSTNASDGAEAAAEPAPADAGKEPKAKSLAIEAPQTVPAGPEPEQKAAATPSSPPAAKSAAVPQVTPPAAPAPAPAPAAAQPQIAAAPAAPPAPAAEPAKSEPPKPAPVAAAAPARPAEPAKSEPPVSPVAAAVPSPRAAEPAKPEPPKPALALSTAPAAAPAVAPNAASGPPASSAPAPEVAATPAPPAAPEPQHNANPAPAEPADPGTTKAVLHALGANLRLDFPFLTPTPAAAFRRGEVLWLVFDTATKLDVAAVETDRLIKSANVIRSADGATALRIRLERPRLISFAPEGPGWAVTIGDSVTDPSQPLQVARSIVGKDRSNIVIPFQGANALHRIADPDIGDTLLVITALAPARGFLKPQDFVELKALASAHGVVVQPLADDINAELAGDKIVINRPGGLMLSTSGFSERDNGGVPSPVMFDAQTWGFDREAKFNVRQSELIWKAAAAPEAKKRTARLNLARFYLARDMIAEAKAVLDVAIAGERGSEDSTGAVLHAAANILMGRTEEGLKELAAPKIGNSNDAPLWRAVALSKQGSWPEARQAFKNTEASLSTLPVELQRVCLLEAARASIEVRDFNGAAKVLNDFETLGIPHDMEPSVALLNGRLSEALGRRDDALAAYRLAADSRDRKAAAQGRLRELVLHYARGDIKRPNMIDDLETLTATWRGDETEGEGLKWLAHLYTEEGRYRDAFHTMRTALLAHPNSDLTRKIQDEAAASFDALFLAGKGDAMPAIEALGLFYDYRELTPIGRRGDEMIRKLADRLVSVDLLEQASDLLQHQVDHRLQGAARAQVATRLAMIYLVNRKPDRAVAALRASRMSDLPGDLREQRLLLEARALSDIGRHDLAIEIVSGMEGPQAKRLRADILWGAKRWREAGEQLEANYGERWKEFAPLNDEERSDILRMAIGYALGDDAMGLQSLREKYAAKMGEGPDRHAFDVVTAPIGTDSAEFRKVVSAAAGVNTLDTFLRDMRTRYPEKPADGDETKPEAANRAPALPPKAPPEAKPKADPATTGSIPAKKASPSASPLPPSMTIPRPRPRRAP